MSEDKKTFGLTPENQSLVDEVIANDLFDLDIDVAKLALSVAINNGLEPGSAEGTSTKWSKAVLDQDLIDFVVGLYPDNDEPIRAIEYLVNEGLKMLKESMDKHGELDLKSLLGPGR